jgi:hypothetical protein
MLSNSRRFQRFNKKRLPPHKITQMNIRKQPISNNANMPFTILRIGRFDEVLIFKKVFNFISVIGLFIFT